MRQVTLLTITPDQLIPADHPIRRVKPLVDTAVAELGPVFGELILGYLAMSGSWDIVFDDILTDTVHIGQ